MLLWRHVIRGSVSKRVTIWYIRTELNDSKGIWCGMQLLLCYFVEFLKPVYAYSNI